MSLSLGLSQRAAGWWLGRWEKRSNGTISPARRHGHRYRDGRRARKLELIFKFQIQDRRCQPDPQDEVRTVADACSRLARPGQGAKPSQLIQDSLCLPRSGSETTPRRRQRDSEPTSSVPALPARAQGSTGRGCCWQRLARGVGVGALIETNLRYHNERCLIPGRRNPNPHCDSLSKR